MLLSSIQLPPLSLSAEIEGEMGDSVMGMQARLMSQALRKKSLEQFLSPELLLSLQISYG